MPHPSTSLAYCPDPPVCISLCGLSAQSHLSVWTSECFGLGAKLRSESLLYHGNLWTWSWTLPKTIDQIKTNMIPSLSPLFCSLPFIFFSQHFCLYSFLHIRHHCQVHSGPFGLKTLWIQDFILPTCAALCLPSYHPVYLWWMKGDDSLLQQMCFSMSS